MILAYEMHGVMRILQVRWTQKATNVEIKKRLSTEPRRGREQIIFLSSAH